MQPKTTDLRHRGELQRAAATVDAELDSTVPRQPRAAATRFAWLVRRHPVRASWSHLIAAVLTVAAIMAILQQVVPLYHDQRGTSRAVETRPHVLIAFLVPAHPLPVMRSPSRTPERAFQTPHRQAPASVAPIAVTPALPLSRPAEPAVPQSPEVVTPPGTTVPRTGSASPTRRAVGPRQVRAGVSTERPLTAAERDSVLAQLSSDVPKLAKKLQPTQADRDSILREQSRLDRVARDQHRPAMLQMPVGSFPLPFPFFSYSGSPEKQLRDSILNADIQARIARILKRGRAKRDSLRRADSLAKARRETGNRGRSTLLSDPRRSEPEKYADPCFLPGEGPPLRFSTTLRSRRRISSTISKRRFADLVRRAAS